MPEKRLPVRTKCPSCRKIIELERRYRRRELITCPHCNQVLEVIRIHPQLLDFPLDPSLLHRGRDDQRTG